MRRPFDRKRVADNRIWIAITLEGPSVNDLSGALFHRLERLELSGGGESGLFGEFPLRLWESTKRRGLSFDRMARPDEPTEPGACRL